MELGKDESKDDREEKGLSTFQIDEEQTKTLLPVVPFPVVGNPYPDQSPKAICERWYQIGFETITKSSTVNAKRYPIYELLNVSAVQDALATFRYIRFSSISFRIQNSTVPMVYGFGSASSMPDISNSANQAFLSFDDTILLDYSVQNDITITIPWRTPDQWLDWFRVGAAAPIDTYYEFHNMYFIQKIFNSVLVLDSTAVPALRFIEYAKFNDLETSGHVDDIDAYQRQSSQKNYFKDYSSDLYSAGSYLSEQFMSFTGRGSNPNDVHRAEIMSHYNATNGTERPKPAKKAKDPSSDPSDPEVRNNPFGSLVSSSSMYTAGSGSLMQPIRDFTVRDFINKPTYIGLLNLTSGMSMQQVWQLGDLYWSRINYMAQYFRMWRGSIRLTFVIFSSPFISARYNFIVRWGGSAPVGLVGNEIVNDVTVRGSTRVDITVPFLSADQWLPTWCQMPGGYAYESVFPAIYIKEQSPAVSVGDIAASPVMLMYESAGVDFEFRSFCNPNPLKDTGVYERQMRVSDFSKQEVSGDGSTCAYPYSTDTEMTFTDITRRWCNRNTDALSPGPLYTDSIATAGALDQVSCLFVYWSGQTKFKLTCATTSTMNCWHTDVHFPSVGSAAELCARPEDGMVNVWTDLTRVLEFTTPFLATTSFLPIPRPTKSINWTSFRSISLDRQVWSGKLHNENNSTIVPARAYVAGGDDFSLYFMLPPPLLTHWPQSVTSLDSPSRDKGFETSVKHKGVVCLSQLVKTQSCTEPPKILDP